MKKNVTIFLIFLFRKDERVCSITLRHVIALFLVLDCESDDAETCI